MTASTTFVVSALIRRGDRILLVEECEPGDPESTWMLPGGKVEAGETLTEALRRELVEETGLQLTGSLRIAFSVDVVAAGGPYSAITFDCVAEGILKPHDPDGLVLRAEWIKADEALRRLAGVEWYDCAPLERFVFGHETPGATYGMDRR